MIVFTIFAESFTRSPALIVSQPAFVKKVVFPLEVLPVVAVLGALIHAAISLMVLLALMVVGRGAPTVTALLVPVVWLPYVLFCLGVAWFLSALGVYLRDIGQVAQVLVTALMFLSPLFYPVSALPEGLRPFFLLNPLTFPIEETRAALLFGRPPNPVALGAYTAFALATMGRICGLSTRSPWIRRCHLELPSRFPPSARSTGPTRPFHRLKQSAVSRAYEVARYLGSGRRAPEYFSEFWALRNVSFEVEAGKCVGILGRNGAGKTTLLEVIAGTVVPTAGEVWTRGKIGALLELGSGFSGEFTGRENVFLSAALLGLEPERNRTETPLHRVISPKSAISSISRSRPTAQEWCCDLRSRYTSLWGHRS
jgi:ABC-type multidrug transport system fused ATPase/permease subunit